MTMDQPGHDKTCDGGNGRRQFFRACIGGTAAVSIGAVGYPIAAFLKLPERVGEDKPVEIPLDRLVVGQAYYAEFQGKQLIVIMTDQGPNVFDASCTHLGCNVVWETAHQAFHCPCHGALFNAKGDVVSGPVSTALRSVKFEVRDGILIIA
jgi:cytochrome b6-f complex iron-sulfur subunit